MKKKKRERTEPTKTFNTTGEGGKDKGEDRDIFSHLLSEYWDGLSTAMHEGRGMYSLIYSIFPYRSLNLRS